MTTKSEKEPPEPSEDQDAAEGQSPDFRPTPPSTSRNAKVKARAYGMIASLRTQRYPRSCSKLSLLGDYPLFQPIQGSPFSHVIANPGAKRKLSLHSTLEFLGHKTTVIVLLLSASVASAVLAVIAVTGPQPTPRTTSVFDDNFYTSLSRTVLSLSSLYCIILPFLRGRRLPIRSFWFWVCLALSAVTAVASPAAYPTNWQVSDILADISGVAQVFATMHLIAGTVAKDGIDSDRILLSANDNAPIQCLRCEK